MIHWYLINLLTSTLPNVWVAYATFDDVHEAASALSTLNGFPLRQEFTWSRSTEIYFTRLYPKRHAQHSYMLKHFAFSCTRCLKCIESLLLVVFWTKSQMLEENCGALSQNQTTILGTRLPFIFCQRAIACLHSFPVAGGRHVRSARNPLMRASCKLRTASPFHNSHILFVVHPFSVIPLCVLVSSLAMIVPAIDCSAIRVSLCVDHNAVT